MNLLRSIRQALIGVALIWTSLTVMSAEITGRVVGVSDGDTITVLVDGHDSVKVRLLGIDAPVLNHNQICAIFRALHVVN